MRAAIWSGLMLFGAHLGCGVPESDVAVGAVSEGRSHVTGYLDLQLDGVPGGAIAQFEEGGAEAEATHCGPHELCVGAPANGATVAWVTDYLAGRATAHSGSITRYNHEGRALTRIDFIDATLVGVSLPGRRTGSYGAAAMFLRIAPGAMRTSPARGPALSAEERVIGESPVDTALTLRDVSDACSGPLTLAPIELSSTGLRGATTTTLEMRVAAECARELFAVHPSSGRLDIVSRSRQKSLLEVTVSGLGIFKLAAAARDNNEDKVGVTTSTSDPLTLLCPSCVSDR